MPRGNGKVIPKDEYRGPEPMLGQKPLNFVRLEDGAYAFTTPATFDETRGVLGPDGEKLTAVHVAVGAELTVDIRGAVVRRIISITYDQASRARALAMAERAAQIRKERLGEQRQEDQKRRRDEERDRAYQPGDVNPYTFLPYLAYRPDEGFLQRPAHHTMPPPGLHTGRLRLRLEVASPVATYGSESRAAATHKARSDQDGGFVYEQLTQELPGKHRVTSLLRDSHGNPTLTGASIKGALRSWYEFITSSHRDIDTSGIAWRDTVLNDDNRQVGMLRLYKHGRQLQSLPVRADGVLPTGVTATIVPVTPIIPDKGDAVEPKDIGDNRVRNLWRDWKPAHDRPQLRNGDELVRRHPDQDTPNRAWLQLGVGVAPPSAGVRILPQPDGGLNGLPTDPPNAFHIGEETLRLWWEAHRGGAANDRKVAVKVGETEVLCLPPDATELRDGTPIFFERNGARITYLSHIRNGRWAIDEIPVNRIPGGVLPDDDDQLDPARRTFGRVTDRGQDASNWAGRIRIARISYVGDATTTDFTLRPLQTNKVQAAGFYLDAPGDGRRVAWRPGRPGQVAGTKIYWHQVAIPDPDGTVDIAERARRTATASESSGEPARMESNTTVEALLDGAFTVELWFEDLDDHELGALILAATLRFTKEEGRVGYKLGMGKPLGLGSVQNELVDLSLVVDRSPADMHLRPLTAEEVESRRDRAVTHWFSTDNAGRQIAHGIAALDEVRSSAFGYPGTDHGHRDATGTWEAEPKAAELLDIRRKGR